MKVKDVINILSEHNPELEVTVNLERLLAINVAHEVYSRTCDGGSVLNLSNEFDE